MSLAAIDTGDLLERAAAARERRLRLATDRDAAYARLRAAIAPESVIRDHRGRLVDHDDYAQLVLDVVMRVVS